jgi:hypothetical protein
VINAVVMSASENNPNMRIFVFIGDSASQDEVHQTALFAFFGATLPAMSDPPRRFPTPWHADKISGGYVVRDANGQALAYLYSRENEDEARQAKVLTADEARRIALNIAPLPELLGKGEPELRCPAT